MLEFFKVAKAAEEIAAAGAVSATAAVGTTTVLALYGVDPGVAMAAALGAVGLMAFDTKIAARQAIPAIALGFAVGTYGAVPLVEYLNRPASWRYICAVVLGLVGYFLLGGAVKLAQRWKRDPLETIKEIKQ